MIVRRRLENALQRMLSLLSAGSRDEAVRRRARRLAMTLERIDGIDDRRCEFCGDESLAGAKLRKISDGGTCAACLKLIEGTAA